MRKTAFWLLVGLLLALHQDYWQWDNASLDFGFMPRSVTYHIGISILAAVVWLVAMKFYWPTKLHETIDTEGDSR